MTQQAYKRLVKEYKQIKQNPPAFIIAKPSEANILDWHYVITGPPGTPYEGGQYHGRVTFPSEYPFKPPRIKMCTPSGRFEVNQRICLSMSDFHEELWNPSWSVSTIINGLLSFMTGNEPTTGAISTPESTKRELARRSKYFNAYMNPAFKENFPELCVQNLKEISEQKTASTAQPAAAPAVADEPAQVTTSIEKIEDPEDRIRARQLQEIAAAKQPVQAASGGLFKVAVVMIAVLVGILLKVSVD